VESFFGVDEAIPALALLLVNDENNQPGVYIIPVPVVICKVWRRLTTIAH
jgi:hypothetical protein